MHLKQLKISVQYLEKNKKWLYDCIVTACISVFWNISVGICCECNLLLIIPKWTKHPDQTVSNDDERIPLTFIHGKTDNMSYTHVCMKNYLVISVMHLKSPSEKHFSPNPKQIN